MAKILVTKENKVLAGEGKIYTHVNKGATGEIEINENGIYDVSDYASANVNVPMPTGKIEITTTEEIDVSQYANAQVIDANLEPQNIVKDVTILGVTGTFEGGGSEDLIEALCNNTLTSYSNSNITQIRMYMFYGSKGLVSVDLPNVTYIQSYAFRECKGLTEINIPNVEMLEQQAFYECKELKSINAPLVTRLFGYTFNNCHKLTSVNLPNVTTVGNSEFRSCKALENISLPSLITSYTNLLGDCSVLKTASFKSLQQINGNYVFQASPLLTDIYLGYDGLVTLENTNAFSNAGTTQGYVNIHVRPKYANQYADATNWSSLIASGQIVIVGDYSD